MFDLSSIEFSKSDLEREIKIPDEMSEHLAEEIGIHVGDGSLGIYKFPNQTMWLYRISGSLEEFDHYKKYVQKLLCSLFNFSGSLSIVAKNECQIKIFSRAIATFKADVLKLPAGSKSKSVRIPEFVKPLQYAKPFLRGLADSDFSFTFKKKHWDVHKYPVIQAAFASKALVDDLQSLLSEMRFKPYTCMDIVAPDSRGNLHKIHCLYLPGKENLTKWAREIGFGSQISKTKFLIWKKFGFCPPLTTFKDRIKILSGDIDPIEFEKSRPRSSAGRAAK